MANVLTGIRILCGILIMCLPAFSGWYYFFYILGGFTDSIDGTVARKTGRASEYGAKFDTVADFVFAIAVLVKLICNLYFPLWLLIWMVVIVFIKIGSYLAGYYKYHELKSIHSVLNKVCGSVIFFVLLFVGVDCAWQAKAVAVIALCIVATIAAIAECAAIFKEK